MDMTKREFDALTKQNYGAHMGHRTEYKRARGRVVADDKVTLRCWEMARRNNRFGVLLDGFLPTLGKGSRHRNIALYRASKGIPLLGW
jgi:hypothetical protein